MADAPPLYDPDDPAAVECYRTAIRALAAAGVEFLVGGAYALARYAGIVRHTKDLDLFLRRRDLDRALAALAAAGFRTEVTYTHWLAKARLGEFFIDLIHSSGNGATPVDDGWFAPAEAAEVLGEPVRLCPPEVMVVSKAFIMERHRFDGADVAHLLRGAADRLDWRRLVDGFGPHWRVLYGHLVLFGFIYPGERDRVPAWVMAELGGRLREELDAPPPAGRVCRGTLLSGIEYAPDVEAWGYRDARLPPEGAMTSVEIAAWKDGISTGR